MFTSPKEISPENQMCAKNKPPSRFVLCLAGHNVCAELAVFRGGFFFNWWHSRPDTIVLGAQIVQLAVYAMLYSIVLSDAEISNNKSVFLCCYVMQSSKGLFICVLQ